nr:DUF4124 domain-containing protein [uncultured Desulfuromonas sp.]
MIRFFILLLIISTPVSAADFYTWRDADGKLHVTNNPPHRQGHDIPVKEYNYEDDTRQSSETFQQRVYQQIDSVNDYRYQDSTQIDEQQRRKDKRRFDKTIEVEKNMLEERIHYFKFRCSNIRSTKARREYCDEQQKLYEDKLDLLNRDPEEYFMRDMRH